MQSVRRIACAALIATLAITGPAAFGASKAASSLQAPTDVAAATRGTDRIAGLFDVYRDAAQGRVLLGVHEFNQPFLLITSLPGGLGSNDVGLDRGQSSGSHLVEFRRAGSRVLLVEDNPRFRALSPNPDEALSVRQAFAESVL